MLRNSALGKLTRGDFRCPIAQHLRRLHRVTHRPSRDSNRTAMPRRRRSNRRSRRTRRRTRNSRRRISTRTATARLPRRTPRTNRASLADKKAGTADWAVAAPARCYALRCAATPMQRTEPE
jgi:hypothetical protein